jgi:uncharacterized protein (TIGR03435 family)
VALRAIFGGLLAAVLCHGQSTPAPPAFDVASVKPSPNCQGGRPSITPGRLELPCITLRALIRIAYGDAFAGANLNPRLLEVLGGPAWLDTDRYAISAKVESSASPAEVTGPMLRTLLEDRFKVKARKEPRETAVYALSVAKSGAKLQPTKEGSCVPFDLNNAARPAIERGEETPRFCGGGEGRLGKDGLSTLDWYGVSMAEVAGRVLSGEVDRPVIDKTELPGRYDIHLEFVRSLAASGPVRLNGADSPAPQAAPVDPSGPSIFTALEEQLGLKLSPAKSSVDVIVVDRAERPSAN